MNRECQYRILQQQRNPPEKKKEKKPVLLTDSRCEIIRLYKSAEEKNIKLKNTTNCGCMRTRSEWQHHLHKPVKYMYESPCLNGIAYSCVCFCSEAVAARQWLQAPNKAADYHTLITRVNWQSFHLRLLAQ